MTGLVWGNRQIIVGSDLDNPSLRYFVFWESLKADANFASLTLQALFTAKKIKWLK